MAPVIGTNGAARPDVAAAPAAAFPAESALLAPVYPFPRLEIVSGKGAWVRDAAGTEYLDFVSGIGVNALGHAPAGLSRAVARQMRELIHTSNIFGNRPAAEFAERLLAATGYDRVFFCNSGTEAVEAALKFARVVSATRGRSGRDIVAFTNGFHGRTALALSATWNPAYREPFLPLVPGVTFAPFNDSQAVSDAVSQDTAAVIVEPVQGEGGAVPARRDFLEALRARTTEVGATLVFDEVQCGLGRCGRLLAAQEFGVAADITILSKALGGGVPFAAVLLRAEAAAALKPGMHGSTFGGGPVAATAAGFVLDRVNRPAFLARVRRNGARLRRGLEELTLRHTAIAGVRGLGLLLAVELRPGAPFDPAALVRAAAEERLLLVRGGERAVRFLPPLNVTDEEIRTGLERFEAGLVRLADRSSDEKTTPAKGEER